MSKAKIVLLCSLGQCTLAACGGSDYGVPTPVPTPTENDGVDPVASDPCQKGDDVTTSETWSPQICPRGYTIAGPITVRGAGTILTVLPGTQMTFETGAGLVIAASAAIKAVGTADKPIVFTGWQPAPGAWQGIGIESDSLVNEVGYATIEYAGQERTGGLGVYRGDGGEAGLVNLHDVVISNNLQYGLNINTGGRLTNFASVVVTKNRSGAVRAFPPEVAQLAGTNIQLGGNDVDIVRIEVDWDDSTMRINENQSWPNPAPAVYRVVASADMHANVWTSAHLTIAPGSVFEMTGNTGFEANGPESGIQAIGTAAEPIIFRGLDGQGWNGIVYAGSESDENVLENVSVKDAHACAQETPISWSDPPASLCSVHSKITMRNVTIGGPNGGMFDVGSNAGQVYVFGTNTGSGQNGTLLQENL